MERDARGGERATRDGEHDAQQFRAEDGDFGQRIAQRMMEPFREPMRVENGGGDEKDQGREERDVGAGLGRGLRRWGGVNGDG